MDGTDDVEVPTVERRDRRDSQSFGGGDDRGIDGPERQVAVASNELGDPKPVVLLDRDSRDGPRREIAEQADLRVRCGRRRPRTAAASPAREWLASRF